MKRFLLSDRFVGLVIALVFLLMDGTVVMQGLERTAYDWGVRATNRPMDDRIAIIAIDDESIANLGRWPWPRHLHARLINTLSRGRPKLIVNTVLFLEPQRDPGLDHLERAHSFLISSGLRNRLESLDIQTVPEAGQAVEHLKTLEGILTHGQSELNSDQQLADAFKRAGNVILAMPFTPGIARGNPDEKLPPHVLKHTIPTPVPPLGQAVRPIPARAALAPIALLGQQAAAVGNINDDLDVDGAVRTTPLILDYRGAYFPSLALVAAARSLNLKLDEVEIRADGEIRLGNLDIRTSDNLRMHTYFHQGSPGQPPFPVDSFYDVLNEKIQPDKYHNKIVLIGPTATGVGISFPTPVSPAMSPVSILAHSISSILNEDFFVVPDWAFPGKLLLYVVIGLYLILLLPRLSAALAAVITIAAAGLLLGLHFRMMTSHTIWFQVMGPLALLVGGYILLSTKRYLLTEKGKVASDAESAESNRMLGLAFQGQGQLDIAFDKFRKCPLNDVMMEVLFNLALDFERKRQFGKAVSVYRHMSEWNPNYKDIAERMTRSETLENTVVLGGGGGMGGDMTRSLLAADGSVAQPMLGRYQVEKELGRGAMGIVYQGRDPKINRVVAIKTLFLGNEEEADGETESAKARFFREAESAGRLNHPNIVTIFDTGEDNDLAFIAMEFLKGRDLTGHTKPGRLLPVPLVIQIIAKVAVALDYAHRNQVVHRDIKPANIMYDPKTRSIKVTDFGIARLTEGGRTRTRTGMVVGTPYYMSPEQIGGHKVDGRSDIFSLGVTFFQLLTGKLPFQAGEMATLIYQITQEPPADLLTTRPGLPPCLGDILDKALQKNPARRFQSGAQLAKALLLCVKSQVGKG